MMRLYALFDKKVGEFQNVIQAKSDLAVMRALGELFATENQVSKYPEDFGLFFLGDMDMESGDLVPVHPPKLICDVVSQRPKIAEVSDA